VSIVKYLNGVKEMECTFEILILKMFYAVNTICWTTDKNW